MNEFITMNSPGFKPNKDVLLAVCKEAFNQADTNGDGLLDLKEFASFMGMNKEDVQDKEEDSMISFAEFS